MFAHICTLSDTALSLNGNIMKKPGSMNALPKNHCDLFVQFLNH